MPEKLRSLFSLMTEVSDWLCADPIVKAVVPGELYSLSELRDDDLVYAESAVSNAEMDLRG